MSEAANDNIVQLHEKATRGFVSRWFAGRGVQLDYLEAFFRARL